MKLLGRLCAASGIGLIGLVPALRMSQPSSAHARTYVVQANDTLSAIALQFHTNIQDLMRRNGIVDPNNLQAGQAITLDDTTYAPTTYAPTSYAQAGQHLQGRSSWPNRGVDSIGSSSQNVRPDPADMASTAAPGTASATLGTAPNPAGTSTYSTASYGSTARDSALQGSLSTGSVASSSSRYIVARGDTLAAISSRFGVSITALMRENTIADANLLLLGQRLIIPGRGSTRGLTVGAASTPASFISSSGSSRVTLSTETSIRGGNGVAATPLPDTGSTGNGSSTGIQAAGQSPVLASQSTIGSLLATEAAAYGIDPALVKAVAWQESGWQMVVARDGGIGVMQLMPATASWVGPSLLGRTINPYNVQDNIQAGVALLASYMTKYGGDTTLALAAYNEGPANLAHGILSSTAQYVASVLSLRSRFG